MGIEYPDTGVPGIAHVKIADAVQCHAIGTTDTPGHCGEDPHFAGASILLNRQAPDGICARHRDEQSTLLEIHDQSVRTWAVVDQSSQNFLIHVVGVHPASGILLAGLTLIGEVELAVSIKEQVVYTLESFATAVGKKRRDRAGFRVENQYSLLVVGDENPAIAVDLESVGPAVIFGDKGPFALWVYSKNTPVGDVRYVEISLYVEGWPFQKAFDLLPGFVGAHPIRVTVLPKGFRQRRKHSGR
ncbi:hypothetical protein D3C76_1024150 [compost metagenome]